MGRSFVLLCSSTSEMLNNAGEDTDRSKQLAEMQVGWVGILLDTQGVASAYWSIHVQSNNRFLPRLLSPGSDQPDRRIG